MIIEDKNEQLKEILKKVTSFINHLRETDKNQERSLIQEILNIREEGIDDINNIIFLSLILKYSSIVLRIFLRDFRINIKYLVVYLTKL